MILSKQNIDVWIQCPYKFGKYVINDTFKTIETNKPSIVKIKNFLAELASHEMKENIKLSLVDYRTKFTNKFYANKTPSIAALDVEVEIIKLNKLFSVFANNVFIGYNIPVDISIPGTNIIYRDFIDFGLSDENKDLTFVEFVNMKEKIYIKDKLKHWAHYYTLYSFIASSFNKDIKVIFIDPDVVETIEFKFNPNRFEDDYAQLINLITPIKTSYLIRNLNSCQGCSDISECFIDKKE